MVLPLFWGRSASWDAAYSAAPEVMPTSTPSLRAISLPVENACSVVTVKISSYTWVFKMEGTNPAPIPCSLWGPGLPPESTGESEGSTATICTLGFLDFR